MTQSAKVFALPVVGLVLLLVAALCAVGCVVSSQYYNVDWAYQDQYLHQHLGATHLCGYSNERSPPLEQCSVVSRHCYVSFDDVEEPLFVTNDQPDTSACTKYNSFRGTLMAATVFLFVALIVGVIHLILVWRGSLKTPVFVAYAVITVLAFLLLVSSAAISSSVLSVLNNDSGEGSGSVAPVPSWQRDIAYHANIAALVLTLFGQLTVAIGFWYMRKTSADRDARQSALVGYAFLE